MANGPKEKVIQSESTSVKKPSQLSADQMNLDATSKHLLGMGDMGFYSDQYVKDRIAGKGLGSGWLASTFNVSKGPTNPDKIPIKSAEEFDAFTQENIRKGKTNALLESLKTTNVNNSRSGYGYKKTAGKFTSSKKSS